MKFKEINDIIDYYRTQECSIVKLHYEYNTIIIETPDNEIKTIRYGVRCETNGEYYYKIL